MTTAPPTLAAVKAWLGLASDDTHDDVVLQESLDGALQAQCRVVDYPVDGFGDAVFTADLRNAIFLRTQRLAARRNSPESVVGIAGAGGDFISAQISSWDSDVSALEGPFRKIPVA